MRPAPAAPVVVTQTFALVCVMALHTAVAQDAARPGPTLAERLGYPADAKLLLLHADDLGVAHSVNAASIQALEAGAVSSASIMVPCPWFPEIAAYARTHPERDFGLHLTLTAEWKHFRWGTVLPSTQVPTLLDAQGYLYADAPEAARHMDVAQAEAELRAQVERALAFGLQPTHLDTHMGTLFQTPALFEAYLRVGRAYGLPVLLPRENLSAEAPPYLALLQPGDLTIDRVVAEGPSWDEDWLAVYTRIIEHLKPGVTELIVHLGYDDAELQAVTIDHPDFGALWRQRDFDVVMGTAFRQLLRAHNVHLITWREVARLRSSER